MHAYAHSNEAGQGQGDQPGFRRRGCRGLPWRPTEIVAMVLGFIVFWPIGLGVLLLKVWQRNVGHTGHLADFAREKWESSFLARWRDNWGDGSMWNCRQHSSDRSARDWRGFGSSRSTGNSAFDDWRTAELARLEEERRKLAAAEKEFSDYMEGLRRARDREEFDRFMNQRRSSPPPTQSPSAPPAN